MKEILDAVLNPVFNIILEIALTLVLAYVLYKIYTKKNRTPKRFISTPAVRIFIFFTLLFYYIIDQMMMMMFIEYEGVVQILPSIAELLSVAVGIVLGFYWNKSSQRMSEENERYITTYYI